MEARPLRQQTLSETRRALVLDAARAVFEEHGIGLDARAAEREDTALFAHGVGLLPQHTGCIRMFKQDATELFDHYLEALLLCAPLTPGDQ